MLCTTRTLDTSTTLHSWGGQYCTSLFHHTRQSRGDILLWSLLVDTLKSSLMLPLQACLQQGRVPVIVSSSFSTTPLFRPPISSMQPCHSSPGLTTPPTFRLLIAAILHLLPVLHTQLLSDSTIPSSSVGVRVTAYQPSTSSYQYSKYFLFRQHIRFLIVVDAYMPRSTQLITYLSVLLYAGIPLGNLPSYAPNTDTSTTVSNTTQAWTITMDFTGFFTVYFRDCID